LQTSSGSWDLTNAVNRNTLAYPLLHQGDHAVDLSVTGRVKVVVVDVELGVGISLASCLEGDADEFLAQNAGKDRVAESAVLVEDLVDNILQDQRTEIYMIPVEDLPSAQRGLGIFP
jgi:hypothetical protein